ncbi:MAG: TolB family protein [Gammaproteobacteria bacterium]
MSSGVPLVVLLIVAAASQLPAGNPHRLAWVDRSGKVIGTIGQPEWSMLYTTISPDATRIAVRGQEAQKGKPSVWIIDVARGARRRLTTHPANEGQPSWSPTGDRLAYLSYRNGLGDLFVRAANGSGDDLQITSNPDLHDFAPSWSPDGKHIVFHTQHPKTGDRNVMYVSVAGDRTPKPVSDGPGQEALATFSPDGRYIAYGSNESGRWEVYVKRFPVDPSKWKVSTNGGVWPRWSGRGNELFFFEGTSLMAAPVKLEPTFSAGTSQKLFAAEAVGMDPAAITQFNPTYDVTRDGQRFVVVQRTK